MVLKLTVSRSQLQARVPGQQTRLADYCAVAMFIHQLLSRGYHFDERSFSGVLFQKKVGKWRGQRILGSDSWRLMPHHDPS